MNPGEAIFSAIGGSNREERVASVLDALTREGWAFVNMKGEAGAGPVGEARDEGWQPIETAPTGGKLGCFLTLAFGPPGDQTVSEGMHFHGRFYAASVFYTGGPHDTKQFTFREHEVKPTHWRPTIAAPGAARPVDEPGEVERSADYRLANDLVLMGMARDAAQESLAETRERLEKVEAVARPFADLLQHYTEDADDDLAADGVVPQIGDLRRLAAALSIQESSAALAGDGKEAMLWYRLETPGRVRSNQPKDVAAAIRALIPEAPVREAE